MCWAALYLENNTFGGFFLCIARDFHLSACGALSEKEIEREEITVLQYIEGGANASAWYSF